MRTRKHVREEMFDVNPETVLLSAPDARHSD